MQRADRSSLIDLRADVGITAPLGAQFDADAIADYRDTLELLSIEPKDENGDTVPGVSLVIKDAQGQTTYTFPNTPPTTTTTLPGGDTTTTRRSPAGRRPPRPRSPAAATATKATASPPSTVCVPRACRGVRRRQPARGSDERIHEGLRYGRQRQREREPEGHPAARQGVEKARQTRQDDRQAQGRQEASRGVCGRGAGVLRRRAIPRRRVACRALTSASGQSLLDRVKPARGRAAHDGRWSRRTHAIPTASSFRGTGRNERRFGLLRPVRRLRTPSRPSGGIPQSRRDVALSWFWSQARGFPDRRSSYAGVGVTVDGTW